MTGAHLFPLESLGLEASQHNLKSGKFFFSREVYSGEIFRILDGDFETVANH